ncbi:type I methionyl aminopeptidase [Candidatus Roizmanbacteria bacterium RIFCSPHIGHO2_01_FULL_39_12b]|uniref:Methionine aminopeptidase n=1 Tax=Candidatus Roizmanbacteria bacterium RIFCSPHIGHO2_01_FULL_39_12b TaxID=1802030 RepID=A0A1F7GC58_9BACT|nr:MAG: type I methionyl aminopeptidase [Candidatus Roizmanbacteria bacterium RIFCSPHIGHO2_01_FULL_39_12b]OGK47086.1 MAG: type I methionyl aminopeptidase [Candidatus Roizmanbacteria bacterium RIFCSPLOWO2_01_FULL_39_19]
MIHLKTDEEIQIMKDGGARLQKIFQEVESKLKPGMTTKKVDEIAQSIILKLGGIPSFKRVSGYHDTICISINDQVVHTPPSSRIILDGDIVTVDIGMFYKGFNTDKANTYYIGLTSNGRISQFLDTGRFALKKGIEKAISGNYIGDISLEIEHVIEGAGYHVIHELTGHGVGKILHEDPAIPGFLKGERKGTPQIKAGMTLAIEVIYAESTHEITAEDSQDWSLVTADGSYSACFEHTIAVLPQSTLILA